MTVRAGSVGSPRVHHPVHLHHEVAIDRRDADVQFAAAVAPEGGALAPRRTALECQTKLELLLGSTASLPPEALSAVEHLYPGLADGSASIS